MKEISLHSSQFAHEPVSIKKVQHGVQVSSLPIPCFTPQQSPSSVIFSDITALVQRHTANLQAHPWTTRRGPVDERWWKSGAGMIWWHWWKQLFRTFCFNSFPVFMNCRKAARISHVQKRMWSHLNVLVNRDHMWETWSSCGFSPRIKSSKKV